MKKHDKQIKRIKTKLSLAKAVDKGLAVFGASSHKYIIRKPAKLYEVEEFERKYQLTLPICYRTFLLEIGNGGESYSSSAAGPFLGIFPLSGNVDELLYENADQNLNGKCVLQPDMTDEVWNNLIKEINDESSDADFYDKISNVYGGILPIGSQGCTYLHGLILNGEYRGRVVNLDMDRQKPKFTFEDNFLDWYERWLDEILDGTLRQKGPSWFGYSKGGQANILLNEYLKSNQSKDKGILFESIIRKAKLPNEVINTISNELSKNKDKNLLCLLTKFDYSKARKHLIQFSKIDLNETIKIIFSYGLIYSNDWVDIIKANISLIDYESYKFYRKILERSNVEYGDIVLPLLESGDVKLKCSVINTLGNTPNKLKYLTQFKNALSDKNKEVNRYALGALYDVKDESLRSYYNHLLERNYNEKDKLEKLTHDQLLRNVKFLDSNTKMAKEKNKNKSIFSRLFNKKKTTDNNM